MVDDDLRIDESLTLPADAITFRAIHASGPGGQNVNKVATAVELRFDARAAPLPEDVRARLLALPDRRIGRDGVIRIKAQTYRSQARNREEALRRLRELIASVRRPPRRRITTRPTAASRRRRLEAKRHRSRVKSLRGRVCGEE